MKIPIKEVKNNFPDVFQLTWVINNICSNKCSYCVPDLNSGTNHYYEWENTKIFLDELFKKHKKIHCSIAGGEPTMSPFFPDLCKIFYDNGHTLGVTTNGVRTERYYSEISPYLNYICFSYHPEYDDNNDLLSKAIVCVPNTKVTIRVMMHAKYWDRSIEFFNRCKENKNISIEAVKVLPWGQVDLSNIDYTEEQLNWFNSDATRNLESTIFLDNKEFANIGSNFYLENGTIDKNANAVDYINGGLTDFYNWKCDIGLEHFFIWADGTIRRGNCHVGGNIGNINDPHNIKWPIEPIVCNQHLCHCATDVLMSKRK
jgi:organic radical activating enzyme